MRVSMKSPAAAFVFENGLLVIFLMNTFLDDICFSFDLIMLIMDSDKHHCISLPESHPKQFDDINNNLCEEEKPSFDCQPTPKQNSSSSEDSTLLTTTTTTTTVEVKVKTTKTSSRKRKLDLGNQNNNDNQINKQAAVTKKKVIY